MNKMFSFYLLHFFFLLIPGGSGGDVMGRQPVVNQPTEHI